MEIRRELAETNRDAYIGDMAMTLNNLGNLHDDLTRYDEAEKEYLEALEIRRKLAKANRDAYIGDVAKSLIGYSVLLLSTGKLVDAKQTCEEALDIIKPLAKVHPQVWNSLVEMTEQLLEDISKNS